jgi:hypothetical protein
MAFVRNPLKELEKSVRDYANPRYEDIKVQELEFVLQATRYEINPQIIEMAETICSEGWRRTTHIDIFSASQHYAVRYVKRESLVIGLNGISSPTHLPMKH